MLYLVFSAGRRSEPEGQVMAELKMTDVQARVNYQLAKGGNPQILIDPDGEIGQRIEPEFDARNITLNDVRGQDMLRFETHGFEFRKMSSEVTDFDDTQTFREIYDAEVEALVRELTRATEVVIFDHTVRTDGDSIRRPARHVHSDYSALSGPTRLHEILDDTRAGAWERGHFGIVNVWRPIEHPVQTAPLAFADPHSIEKTDWTDIDIVYPDRRGQITGLKGNDAHQWFYMSSMTPDDVVVFLTFDSAGRPPVAHSAVDLIHTPENATPRKSIETRALVRFA